MKVEGPNQPKGSNNPIKRPKGKEGACQPIPKTTLKEIRVLIHHRLAPFKALKQKHFEEFSKGKYPLKTATKIEKKEFKLFALLKAHGTRSLARRAEILPES